MLEQELLIVACLVLIILLVYYYSLPKVENQIADRELRESRRPRLVDHDPEEILQKNLGWSPSVGSNMEHYESPEERVRKQMESSRLELMGNPYANREEPLNIALHGGDAAASMSNASIMNQNIGI